MPVHLEYETVKLGKASDGRLFLLSYPDAYGKSDPVVRAKKVARAYGYHLSPEQIQEIDDCTGLPVWLEHPRVDE
jgi:hypothetical protein